MPPTISKGGKKIMAIGYQFIPVQREYKERMFKANLTGNQYKVLDVIASEVFSFPESRETLKKELSYRYIAKRLNMARSTVIKAVKKLVVKGLIQIVKVGKNKVGSIIRLIVDGIKEIGKVLLPKEKKGNKTSPKKSAVINRDEIGSEMLPQQQENIEQSIAITNVELGNKTLPNPEKIGHVLLPNDEFLGNNLLPNKEPLLLKKPTQQEPPFQPSEVVYSDIEEEETVESVRAQIEESIGRKLDWAELEKTASFDTEEMEEEDISPPQFTNNVINNNNNEREEFSSIGSILPNVVLPIPKQVTLPKPITSAPAKVTPPQQPKENRSKIFLEKVNKLASIGIRKEVIFKGVTILRDRNCELVEVVLEEIANEIKFRRNNIKYKGSYFIAFCEKIDFIEIEEVAKEEQERQARIKAREAEEKAKRQKQEQEGNENRERMYRLIERYNRVKIEDPEKFKIAEDKAKEKLGSNWKYAEIVKPHKILEIMSIYDNL